MTDALLVTHQADNHRLQHVFDKIEGSGDVRPGIRKRIKRI